MGGSPPFEGTECWWGSLDRESRRGHAGGQQAQLIVRLGPGFDAAALVKLSAEARAASPKLLIHDAEAPSEGDRLPGVLGEPLRACPDLRRGEGLRFDVIRYARGELGTDLAMTWSRALFGPRRAEHLLEDLNRRYEGARPSAYSQETLERRWIQPRARRREQARVWREQMSALGLIPPRSLARRRSPRRLSLRVDSVRLAAEESSQIRQRAAARAASAWIFFLAALIRAHHAVHCTRGLPPSSYVVPVPLSRGIRRESILFVQVLHEQLIDFDVLLQALGQQWSEALERDLPEHTGVAIETEERRLIGSAARRTRGFLSGELASFFFLHADPVLEGVGRILGAPIRDALHVPGVPASPGCHSVIDGRADRLRLTQVWQSGTLSGAELDLLQRRWRRDLREA